MKRKTIWILALLLLFVSSYYREVIFRSINAIIEGKVNFYAKTMELSFIKKWSASQLIRFKYGLTILSTLIFSFTTLFGLKNGFNSKTPFYICIVVYVVLFTIAAITFIAGISFSSFNDVYPLLRKIIGIIHNPLLFLLVSIGYISYTTIEESKK